MKKRISVLLATFVTVSSLMLAACGGNSGGDKPAADSVYIGTWEAVRGELKGETIPVSEILEENEKFILELREDGTATVYTDTDTVEEGTWTENSKGIHVKAGETDSDFTADGDTLYISIFGAKIIFEKQQ